MKKFLLFLIFINFMLMNYSCSKNIIEPDTAYVSGASTDNLKNKEIYLQYILQDSLITDTTMVDSDGKFNFRIAGIKHPVHAVLTNDLATNAPKVKPINRFRGIFTFTLKQCLTHSRIETPCSLA